MDDFVALGKDFPHTKFYNVRGNVDDYGDSERLETFEGVPIYMTHIKQNIHPDAKIVLYGDTHAPALYVNSGITYMDPGSICKDYGFRTFGLIDVFEDEYTCEIKFFDSLVL